MKLRSLLFVPGDRPERLEKAKGLEADALILDLEDSVTPTRKTDARSAVAEFLNRTRGALRRFVRINSPDTELADQDLEAVMCERPDALVLPKAEGAASIRDLDKRLARLGDVSAGSARCDRDAEGRVQTRGIRRSRGPGLAGRRWCVYFPMRRWVLHTGI